ncbi:thermosome subunit alpha [Halobaculum sp. MBLA0147]|uniref:thermosome subunit alpha n=1 Tax=Halobaculum sp. MBLA0147 TaxID=3079934 RepID=UPI0035261FB8
MSGSQGAQRRRGGAQPLFIMSEDAERTSGEDAQSANIEAGKAVAESVRTTLGPRGMDKMLVSDSGDVVITNDGATILEEMDIDHPAAEMLVEVAESQAEDVGDGTTTAVTLAGELLSEFERLLEDDIHPTTVVQGYKAAERAALEAVDEAVVEGEIDDETLTEIVTTSMTGKGTGGVTPETLAGDIVTAVRRVETDAGVDRNAISITTQPGSSAGDTELIEGIVAEESPVREDLAATHEDVQVGVLDADLDQRDLEADAEWQVSSRDQLDQALAAEEQHLQEYAEAVLETDTDVLFVTGDVNDQVAGTLAREGVVVFDSVDSDTAASVAKATGAGQIGDVEDLEDDDLGFAESVRLETFDDDLVFVEGGGDTETVTLFVRGGTGHVTDELERAVRDGVDAATQAADTGEVVPGAGATELAVAAALREEAASVEGREQLAVEAFADALDVIPRTLAQNAGQDPIDALVDLRAANEEGRAGLVQTGEDTDIVDPVAEGVVDPASVKREAISSATEAATMLARIDDVISAE